MTKTETNHISSLIQEEGPSLKAFVRARVPNEQDAEDMLQEIWFQLSRNLAKGEIQQPKAWLYRVARNKIIDAYRKKSEDWLEDYLYDPEDEEGYWEPEAMISDERPDLAFLQQAFWEGFYEAIESLPEKQREVFMLNEWEDLTLREIAEQKGENLKTIISRKTYALQQLRLRLRNIFEEF